MKGFASWDREHSYPPVKGQDVRLLDVLLLGPAMMIAGGFAARRGMPITGGITFIGGFATIVYNAINYGRIEERKEIAAHLGVPMAQMPGQGLAGYGGKPTRPWLT